MRVLSIIAFLSTISLLFTTLEGGKVAGPSKDQKDGGKIAGPSKDQKNGGKISEPSKDQIEGGKITEPSKDQNGKYLCVDFIRNICICTLVFIFLIVIAK